MKGISRSFYKNRFQNLFWPFLIFSLFFFRPLLLKLFTFLCFAATSFNAFSSWVMASAFLVVVSGKARVWTRTQRTGASSFSFAGLFSSLTMSFFSAFSMTAWRQCRGSEAFLRDPWWSFWPWRFFPQMLHYLLLFWRHLVPQFQFYL